LKSYSTAIWVAAQCNDADIAINLLNEMIECNTTPTIVSYNGVFSALASSGNVEMILQTFQDMKRLYSHNILPNFMTYFHIARCLQKIKEDEERLAYLWRVYALMDSRDRQVKVGGHLLESLIQTYGALEHFDEAMGVFDSITGLSNSACLRAILFACSAAEPPEWEMALSLLHASDIVEDGVGPGLVEPGALCNAMLACSKAGEWEESLQLMRLYGEQSGLSIVAVNSLIAACGRAGRPDMSMEILYEVEGRGMKLDARSYRSTIIACNQAEHVYRRSLQLERQSSLKSYKRTAQTKNGFEWWECAISLLRRMKESGLQPDTPTLSSTISACEAAGQWQRALHILQSAMNDDASVALNVYCFNAAISACEKGGAWVEALEIYEKMKAQGGSELRPNLVTVSSLVLALDVAAQKEFAVNVYREGLRKRYIQTPWRMTKDSSSITNEPIMAMDLHTYSAAMARAAIRHHMNTLLSRPGKVMMTNMETITTTTNSTIISDWIIIVGQGYHSIDGRPVLKDTVLNVLQTEYGIAAIVDDRNLGRVIIPANSIQQFISKRRW
jgi:pentatricopeptide repeat protein